MIYKLRANSFSLVWEAKTFYSDMQYPNSTILEVILESDGFRANTTMDIDIKEFRVFASEINNLYETLQGSATIKETYGKQKIRFSVDKTGHVFVAGLLHNNCRNGHYQLLEFENSFEPSFLKSFVRSLTETTP